MKTVIKKSIISLSVLVTAFSLNSSCKQGSAGTGYQKLKSGIEYNLFSIGKGDIIKDSSFVKMHIVQKAGDTSFVNTYKKPGEPVLQFLVKNPNPQGMDYSELFFKMKAGDSMVIRLNQDSVFKGHKPPFVKATDEVLVIVKVTQILNKMQKDSLMAEQQKMAAMQQQQQQEMQKKQMEEAKTLAPKEDAQIQAYCKAQNIIASKTASGLYYAITQKGSGAMPANGQNLTMNYTGMLLDGKKFDSNVDPAFNHVQPFTFPLGAGRVIRGWDEGIALMPVGSKGVLLIPSFLGYGAQGSGERIPPNSILRFDVEVVDAK